MPARADSGCSARDYSGCAFDGHTKVRRALNGRRRDRHGAAAARRDATRTSTVWPGVTASSVGGGAKAANGPVGSDRPAGCAVAETCKTECRHQRVGKLLFLHVEQVGDVGLVDRGTRAAYGRQAAGQRWHRVPTGPST